ncbi:SIR2-domain-containing protein [Suhomyces tanzawaensis NRRL Y-17324]|uniref:SIR2-domain-containing protein n=1 Tax=Suhomyces tanzawaensis NRRL Y-17324 TaxID=984487 RepID=A0A1E4SCA1_9ASCO|nr:SIR2-domain-containing protein [Suhomyces tanzawaensis NRRL Y-17324]ODV77129.1 SIR2-domain-containing protein [Suhomyces tanzawaensis NRRL Y-17324]
MGPVTYTDHVAVYKPDRKLNRKYRSYLKQHGVMLFLTQFIPSTVSKADLCKLILDLGYSKYLLRTVESLTPKQVVKVLMNLLINDKIVVSRTSTPAPIYSFENLLAHLKTAKKIMVITGAGILTPLGIPDFRSFKGLYTQLKHLNLKDPQEVFNIDTFNRNPNIFYSIAHMILPPEDRFTILHSFIKLLQDKGKLLRDYTQNIDNLESRVGIPKHKLVQCHGSFGTATCITCHSKYSGSMIFDHIRHKQVPRCFSCYKDISMNDEVAINYGVIKPDITFFGEELPKNFHGSIKSDINDCDLVLVIGTSLKVYPVAGIIDRVPSYIPRILINKDDLPGKKFDLKLLGDSDDTASYISKILGKDWDIPNKDYCNENEIRIERDELDRSIYRVK